jgi:tryptophan halogenase
MLSSSRENISNKNGKYVVAGGGTAGWFSAAILTRALYNSGCKIELVESPNVPTIGVGEATIPSIIDVLTYLQIPVKDFMVKTNATFKLGIKFVDWHSIGDHYWHQFGYVGSKIDGKPFYQQWLKHHLRGGKHKFTDFSPSVVLAQNNKFLINNPKQPTNLSASTFALHFDAGLVAKYLEEYCVNNGVIHTRGHISKVDLNNNGSIGSLSLDDNTQINGDFFIDCTGQSALLIGKALNVRYESWEKYLPVNRAVAVQTERTEFLPPYTLSVAHEHGWRWQIPLQNRTGNGYVYSNQHCDDESALTLLNKHISGKMLNDPKVIKFETGKRDKQWYKNCLAIGLSGGFLEPLESTSINLIVKGMLDFIEFLPNNEIHQPTIDEYNRLMDIEYECIRDFIVLHYCKSSRKDSTFWNMWQNNEIPQTLQNKLDIFEGSGRLYRNDLDLFTPDSWYAVLEGMKVRPKHYDPTIDCSNFEKVESTMAQMIQGLNQSVSQQLTQDEFIKRFVC